MPSEFQFRPRYTAVWVVLVFIFLMGMLGDCLRISEPVYRDADPDEVTQPTGTDGAPAVGP